MQRITKYKIVGVSARGEIPTHEDLVKEVNKCLKHGYQPLGRPFFGEEMMYQALVLTDVSFKRSQ